jgi:predicted DCC family thiol-disulfide oxidoreductase YuxK
MNLAEAITSRLYGAIAGTHFPRVTDTDAMLRWIGYIRIAVGLVAFVRVSLIVESSRFYYDGGDTWTGLVNSHQTELALWALGLITLFILGLGTPLVTLGLLITYEQIDERLGTPTLGTQVFTLMLTFFLLAGAGSHVSVDARLGRRVRWLYALGRPDARQLTILLFGLFVGYALISLAALFHHMADEYWRHGDTIAVLLTSPYLSRIWEPMRALQEFWPWGVDAFSRVAVIGQTVFQLGMLVLIRWRWGLYYVIGWGGVFILISVGAILLSYLPWVEVCLWALLWVRPFASSRAEILYDDRCNLCRGTVRLLRALDPLKAFALLPLSSNEAFAAQHGASADDILEDLHGVRGGRLLRGYDLYRALSRANPLLWPLVPVLELGRLTRIGPWIYAAVARRRRRLFGTCELGGAPAPQTAVPAWRQPAAVTATASTLLAVLALTMMLNVTQLKGLWQSLGLSPLPAGLNLQIHKVRTVIGFVPPNVFNATDLKMSEYWWTATWEAPDGRSGMVPLNQANGDRAWYHTSDVLYFGNSLPWRRAALTFGDEIAAANGSNGLLRPTVDLVLRYHRRRTGGRGPFEYVIRIYSNRSTDVALPPEERYRAELRARFRTTVP